MTGNRRELKFGKHEFKIQNKSFVDLIFDILLLSWDVEQEKSSCLPEIAKCLPSGKFTHNILARLLRYGAFI